jgi:hypothetical protein
MDPSYPIGRFDWQAPVTAAMRARLIAQIAEAPARFREAVHDLDDRQLDTPYRSGGWTVRQVVHHVADSHMNSYVRFRLALTEDNPTVKAYDQEKWAELEDARTAPIELSLELLHGLHSRWVAMLNSLSDGDFARTFHHSELGRIRQDTTLAQYVWHCRHHLAHITALREKMGWTQAGKENRAGTAPA